MQSTFILQPRLIIAFRTRDRKILSNVFVIERRRLEEQQHSKIRKAMNEYLMMADVDSSRMLKHRREANLQRQREARVTAI